MYSRNARSAAFNAVVPSRMGSGKRTYLLMRNTFLKVAIVTATMA